MSEEYRHLRSITKGAMIVFLGMFIGKVLGYITRIVVARFYGADAYGLFSIAAAILGIITTLSLIGIPTSLSRFIPFYIGKNDLDKVRSVVSSGLKLTIPISIVMGVIVFVFSFEISQYFGDVRLVPLLQIFSIVTPFSVLFNLLLGSYRGFQSMKYKALIEDIIKPLSTIVLIIAFFMLGFDIFGVVVSYSIGFVLTCILGIYLLWKLVPPRSKEKKSGMKKELVSFSWPLIISGYLWMFISWSDIIILGLFRTAQEVGIYNIALPTAAMLMIVLDAFSYIFMPVISELFAKGQKKSIILTHKAVLKWVFMINLSIFLLIILFPDNVLKVLFGEEYVSASMPMIIVASGYMISQFGALSGQGITSIGKTKLNLFVVAIGSIGNLMMNLALIPIYGMIGAAIATSIAFIIMGMLDLFLGWKYIGLNPFDKSYLKAIVSGSVSVSVFYFGIKIFYSSPPWWILVITLPVFFALYALLFLMMRGFDKNDVMILKSVEEKTGIRIEFIRKLAKRFL